MQGMNVEFSIGLRTIHFWLIHRNYIQIQVCSEVMSKATLSHYTDH